MFCSKCGAKIDDEGQLFCENCGAKRPGIKVPVANMKQESSENSVNIASGNTQVTNSTQKGEQSQDTSVTSNQQKSQDTSVTSNQQESQVTNVTSNEEQATNQNISSSSTSSQSVNLNKKEFEFVQEKPAIPAGFVLDPQSGWFYKSKAKQLPNGAYVNEITWFEPTTGKTAVKEYPMSEQQVRAMQGQYGQNTRMNQQMNYAQQNTYQQQQSYSQIQPKKKKTGLIIGIVAAIVVLIGLGVCAWQFEWLKFGKDDKDPVGGVNIVTATVAPALTLAPTPTPTLTPTPTPTEAPINPLGILNEDYIVVGKQEIVTTQEKLYLEYKGLTNEDLESLQYMKNLEYLNVKGNNITSLDFIQNIDTLTYLDASENDIYDINALEGLINLKSLELNHTKISDLTPLQNLKSLTNLSVKDTDVFDISPLTSNELLLYLYVANTKVEDFSCLSELPNLYFCDSCEVGSSITPTPYPQPTEGFIFTEGDNEYFIPATDNYVIVNIEPTSYEQIVLFSYDEYGTCVQMRFRMDVGFVIPEEDRDYYTSSLQEEFEGTNFSYDGSVIYFDYPTTSEEFLISKDELIAELEEEGMEILINENYYDY